MTIDDLTPTIIRRILNMKNGTRKTTPQPEAARAEQAYFHKLFAPFGVDVNGLVAEAGDALKGKK